MSDENSISDSVESIEITQNTKEEKRIEEYTRRVKRTLVACFAGAGAGIVSYLTQGISTGQYASDSHIYLAFFIMLAAIVLQKHIFMVMRVDITTLGKKDWFYQGFMTFAFWFVSWTFLLSGSSVM